MSVFKAIQNALKLTYNDSEEEKEYRRLKLPLNKEYHKWLLICLSVIFMIVTWRYFSNHLHTQAYIAIGISILALILFFIRNKIGNKMQYISTCFLTSVILFAIYNMNIILKKVHIQDAFFIGYALSLTQRLLDFRSTNVRVIILFNSIFLLAKFFLVGAKAPSLIVLVTFLEFIPIILGFKAEKADRSLHHSMFRSKTQLEKFKRFLTEFLPNQMAIFTQDLGFISFINNAFKKSFHCQNVKELKSSLQNLTLDAHELDKHRHLFQLIGCCVKTSPINLQTLLEKIMTKRDSINDLELLSFQVYDDQENSPKRNDKNLQDHTELHTSHQVKTLPSNLTVNEYQVLKSNRFITQKGDLQTEENCNRTARRVFKVRIIPLVWDDKDSFCLILDNVTHEKTILELKIADKNKDLVIAMVSHELRTPLNGVLGLLEIIGKSLRQPEIRPYLDACKNSGLMLLNLVNSILDMSQIRENKLKFVYTQVCLLDLLNEVKSLFDHFCQAKHLYFNIEVHPDVPFDIVTDETRLRQILINLAGNAFKFTFEGGITLKVDIESQKPCHLKFIIEDTGIGIKIEDQQKLFKLFGRLEQQNKNVNKHGVGLGLTISNMIVMEMDPCQEKRGIQVSSEPGKGTAFSFIIVADQQKHHDSDLIIGDETDGPFDIFEKLNAYSPANGQNSPSHQLKTRIQSKNLLTNLNSNSSINTAPIGRDHIMKLNYHQGITLKNYKDASCPSLLTPHRDFALSCLIVDDNPFNLIVATNLMQEQGYTVITALNGLEALQKAKDNQFSLILMDCQMPVMDGYEATRQLKIMMKNGEIHEIPVVALTANTRDEEHDKLCKEAGMDDIIGKPLKRTELHAKLKQLL